MIERENDTSGEVRAFGLGPAATDAIIDDLAAFLKLDEEGRKRIADRFVQALVMLPDGQAFLGIDGRAKLKEVDSDKLPCLEPLAVNQMTTVLGRNSCEVVVVTGGHIRVFVLNDSFCR